MVSHRTDPDKAAGEEEDRSAPGLSRIPPDIAAVAAYHNSSCFSSDWGGHIHATTPAAYVPGNSSASKDLVVPSFTVCSMVVKE